jgi:hypothetical protein
MPDIIISPAGFIAKYNWPSYPQRGVPDAPYTVAKTQMAGGSLITRGVGEIDFKSSSSGEVYSQPIGGEQGTFDIQVITPTSGLLALAFLVDNPTTPTGFLGLYFDSTARATLVIKDIFGVTQAQTTSSAAGGVPGVPLQLHVTWNSQNAISGTRFAEFKINGIAISTGDWTVNPVAAWSPFTPAALLLGVGNVLSLSDFTPHSGIQLVQLGQGVVL